MREAATLRRARIGRARIGRASAVGRRRAGRVGVMARWLLSFEPAVEAFGPGVESGCDRVLGRGDQVGNQGVRKHVGEGLAGRREAGGSQGDLPMAFGRTRQVGVIGPGAAEGDEHVAPAGDPGVDARHDQIAPAPDRGEADASRQRRVVEIPEERRCLRELADRLAPGVDARQRGGIEDPEGGTAHRGVVQHGQPGGDVGALMGAGQGDEVAYGRKVAVILVPPVGEGLPGDDAPLGVGDDVDRDTRTAPLHLRQQVTEPLALKAQVGRRVPLLVTVLLDGATEVGESHRLRIAQVVGIDVVDIVLACRPTRPQAADEHRVPRLGQPRRGDAGRRAVVALAIPVDARAHEVVGVGQGVELDGPVAHPGKLLQGAGKLV